MLLLAEIGGADVRPPNLGQTSALANVHHLLGVILQSSGENLDLEENVGAVGFQQIVPESTHIKVGLLDHVYFFCSRSIQFTTVTMMM